MSRKLDAALIDFSTGLPSRSAMERRLGELAHDGIAGMRVAAVRLDR